MMKAAAVKSSKQNETRAAAHSISKKKSNQKNTVGFAYNHTRSAADRPASVPNRPPGTSKLIRLDAPSPISVFQAKFKTNPSVSNPITFEDNSAGTYYNGVTQFLIYYIKKSQKYGKNSKRSGWQVHADSALVQEYNERMGASLPKIPYKTMKLSRDHIGSFDGLQQYIVDYLNGTLSGSKFVQFVADFTAALDKSSDEYAKIIAGRGALAIAKGTGNTQDILADANKLLSRLNNLSKNLRAADKYINSYIQERPDLVFIRNEDGTFSLDTQSRNVLGMGAERWGNLPLTPERGERVVTSQGPVPKSALSPTSKPLVENYPSVRVPIRSKNVRERLYGSSAHSHFRSRPKPKIDLSASSQVPPPPPPPRYNYIQKVWTYRDGTAVWKSLDTHSKSLTFLLVAVDGTRVIRDFGPDWTPPPRFNSIEKVLPYQDGTAVWKSLDTHSNSLTFLLVAANGTDVIKNLGPGWTPPPPPPRYNSIEKIGTYQDGTAVWKSLDTQSGSPTFLLVAANGTDVIRNLGPSWGT